MSKGKNYFYFILLLLVFFNFIESQTDSTRLFLKSKLNFGMLYQNNWNINTLNKSFNVPEINNNFLCVRYSVYIIYRNFILYPSTTLASEIMSNRFIISSASLNSGYQIKKLTSSKIYFVFHYTYTSFQYNMNYFQRGSLVSLNNSPINGGTLKLNNNTSLIGISLLMIKYNKKFSNIHTIELFYQMGPGNNSWKSSYYNLNLSSPIKEQFSILGALLSF